MSEPDKLAPYSTYSNRGPKIMISLRQGEKSGASDVLGIGGGPDTNNKTASGAPLEQTCFEADSPRSFTPITKDQTDAATLVQGQLQSHSIHVQSNYKRGKPGSLAVEADQSWETYQRSKRSDDLDAAICSNTSAHEQASEEPGRRLQLVNRVAILFLDRAQRLGQVNDIEKAIQHCKQAVELAPDDDEDRPAYLNNLGNAYYLLFSRLGKASYADQALEFYSQSISLMPDTRQDKPTSLNNLGSTHFLLFERRGTLEDIYKAIGYHTQAVALTPGNNPDKSTYLDSLGSAYGSLFERLGNMEALHNSVDYHMQAVKLTPENHPDRPICLNNLGSSYHALFDRLGELNYIHSAIECFTQAIDLIPDGHIDKSLSLNNLGGAYHSLFQRLGESEHLQSAIDYYRHAFILTPDGHPDRLARLNNLGTAYHSMFECSGDLEHLQNAIDYYSQAVLIPDNHPDKPSYLNNLTTAYCALFKYSDKLEDLQTSIDYGTQAVTLIPADHLDRPACLNNLGGSYYNLFKHLNKLEHLHSAIHQYTQAATLTPEGHPDKARYSNILGKLHFLLYEITDQVEDANKSCNYFKSAALSPTGHPSVKLEASTLWAPHPMNEVSTLLDVYGHCMALLPETIWLGTTVQRRYESLTSEIQSTAADAVMMAIFMQNYGLAIEWLEQGRCLVWGQMLQLRTPLDDLANSHPEIAKELQHLSYQLEHASVVGSETQPTHDRQRKGSLRDIALLYSKLADQRDRLIKRVRLLPGFDDFLRPPKASKLVSYVSHGVAVIINVQMLRCDAIIVESSTQSISHITLDDFSIEKAEDLCKQMATCLRSQGISRGFKRPETRSGGSLKDILATLWSDIVKPVIDHLGISHAVPLKDLPSITWCVTGPLAFLPIHAAGLYDNPNTILPNLAISSYTPNLSSLSQSRVGQPAFSGVLAVGHQSSVRHLTPLPGIKDELDRVEQQLVGKKFTRLDEGAATTDAVLTAMANHSWVHFACHASQDPLDPQKSALHLHDGDLDLATISRHPTKNINLAILSACQTATGAEALPDEAVHLAAGLLMTGCPNVIATMWSISDEDAPIVSGKLYEFLLEDQVPDSRKSPRALHMAVKQLRDTIGVNNFVRWVPYVHVGGISSD